MCDIRSYSVYSVHGPTLKLLILSVICDKKISAGGIINTFYLCFRKYRLIMYDYLNFTRLLRETKL